MSHPDLTSHHVNYLIWRLLGIFKNQATDGNPKPFSPADHFFGPAVLEPEPRKSLGGPGENGTDQAPASPTSKIARDEVINGHLAGEPVAQIPPNAKKSRKNDRAEINGEETPMEIDSNGISNETKSMVATSPSVADTAVDGDGDVSMGIRPDSQDQEPTATPTFTLTNGHSVGVQITPAKAADLSPDTAILDVAETGHVTRALWRPADPTVIVAVGDSFCSLWKMPSSATPVQEKLVESKGDSTCVSAVAWDPSGQKLAVATYNDMRGSITMYDVAGNAVDLLPEVPRMITGLHWTESGSHLIVVASDSKISELALWDDSVRPDEFPSPQVIDGSIYDLSWLGRNQAYASGIGSVYQCDVDSSIYISKTFTSENDRTWNFIRCAIVDASSVAVAASSAAAALWIPTHEIHLDDAHEGDITAIELKPNAFEQSQSNHSLVLASSSTDDTVKIWHIDLDIKRFDCIHRLFLGPSSPALASCFSPDGYALAAASKEKLFIWNSQRGGTAMATWTAPKIEETKVEEEQTHLVNGHNGNVESISDRSLVWDTDGKRLAFGFGKQLAIINMQS
ncbi:hypothetical protein BBP40_001618 [Aspergillus hancockii]|nr:hypothetical protein BBP40_001618 [Aspergillus hancockii]